MHWVASEKLDLQTDRDEVIRENEMLSNNLIQSVQDAKWFATSVANVPKWPGLDHFIVVPASNMETIREGQMGPST